MMLLVLHENPYEAAKLVPFKIKHKQLLELMQMISCVVKFGYKNLPTGKKLKEWIQEHSAWVYTYAKCLYMQVFDLQLEEETRVKYKCLLDLLYLKSKKPIVISNLKSAIFRYSKEYREFTEYETNVKLPIDIVIEEYKKYMEWKGEKWQ